MVSAAILKIDDEKKMFKNTLLCEDYQNIKLIKVCEKKRVLKKLNKTISGEMILVSNKDLNKKIFRGKLIEYNLISYDIVNAIIKKICKSIVKKYNLQYPLNEIVMVGKVEITAPLVSAMADESRIFTVVSEDYDPKMIDKLYFENGCIVRRKEKPEFYESSEKIIIYAGNNYDFSNIKIPLINLTNEKMQGTNILNITDVKVSDDDIADLAGFWEGDPGVVFYSLLDRFPVENMSIDINTKANKIFLLDRS